MPRLGWLGREVREKDEEVNDRDIFEISKLNLKEGKYCVLDQVDQTLRSG